MRIILILLAGCAVGYAQQADLLKLAPFYQRQRDMANDVIAQCSVLVTDLQSRVADLEKQLAEAKK
jgi:hypothetical protein